jgi:acetyltransferase-like isoleucine patch superfamily enzyme
MGLRLLLREMKAFSEEFYSMVEASEKPSGFSRLVRTLLYPLLKKLSIWKTIRFNVHYFPLKVAVRLPVFVYWGVRLQRMKGSIELDFHHIRPGSVQIGKESYGFQTRYHQTIWEQLGGTVIFGESVRIGKGTFITIGRFGLVRFGNHVIMGGNDKVICKKSISIGDHSMIAWDVELIDTDFHHTVNTVFKTVNCVEKPIVIGNHNWLGFGSTMLKGTVTSDHCIVAAKTVLKSDYSEAGENIILSQETSAKVVAKYIQFDETHVVESSEWEDIDKLINLRNKRRAI